MDSGTVCRKLKAGRRVRPGSMIASRMQVFEAAIPKPNGKKEENDRRKAGKSLFKASSMINLVGAGRSTPLKATPTTEARGVVCNPSTGQAIIPRVSSTSSLLTCIRAPAATGGHTHKPHPQPTPPIRGGSTSSTDSDYSTGSQHSPPRDEDPCNLELHDDPPQTSPTTGARGGSGVRSLKDFFEKSRHAPLSRAASLPHLAPSPVPFSLTPSPRHHPHKVPVMLPQIMAGGRGPKSSTLPTSSSLRKSPGRQAKLKSSLLPPLVKHVRIVEPCPQRKNLHDNAKSTVQTHKKVPLLSPLALRTPSVINSSPLPSSVPPPKPPRAPNRLQLHNIEQESRPSPSTTDAIPSKTEQPELRSRAKTFGSARQTPSSSSSGPRTLKDYQQLSARSQRSKVKSPDEDESEGGSTMPVDELQRYLVAYVNQELSLSPSIPYRGKALYDVCSDPSNLCKLINRSVRHTVDLRALTIVTSNMSPADREEADQENMTLTIESARAIGCRITESTGDQILRKDPPTIRSFLIDLIRARVVNMPGMDDEPATTFSNLSVLFSKLGISEEGVDGKEEGENGEEGGGGIKWREVETEELKRALETPPKSPPTSKSWRDMDKPVSPTDSATPPSLELTYEERAAQRRAERERRDMAGGLDDTSNLTYEERAAIRRAEREKKRQERAELASSH